MSYLSLRQHIRGTHHNELIQAFKEREKKETRDEKERVERFAISLPEDLLIDILCRLPVKYLLQFKCVSKSWYRMITSASFASLHLERNNRDMSCFLTLHSIIPYGEVELYGRFVDQSLGIYVESELDTVATKNYRIYGPCNGIYYIGSFYDGEKRLWNPTINDIKVLPPMIMKPGLSTALSTGLTRLRHVTYGFGYDPLTKDYKVVSINNYSSKRVDINPILPLYMHPTPPLYIHHTPSLYVYSLITNSWKYWGDIPTHYDIVPNNKSHVFVNGCLYWVGCRWNDKFEEIFVGIISFNIITNVLQEIELPEYEDGLETSLGVYKDSVAFYTVHGVLYQGERSFDIQTFNDGCWTNKFSIPIQGLGYLRPIGYLKNDMAVLNNYCNLLVCDLNTGNITAIAKVDERCDMDMEDNRENEKMYRRTYLCESVIPYTESLVSVNKYAT